MYKMEPFMENKNFLHRINNHKQPIGSFHQCLITNHYSLITPEFVIKCITSTSNDRNKTHLSKRTKLESNS